MHRVGTLEMLAAEEGQLDLENAHSAPQSPMHWGDGIVAFSPPHRPGHNPGWQVPNADQLLKQVTGFVTEEAASIREGYLGRVAAAARDQMESGVAAIVSSDAKGSVLPTTTAMREVPAITAAARTPSQQLFDSV